MRPPPPAAVRLGLGIALALTLGARADAAELHADMQAATPTGPGASVGTVTIGETPAGVVFRTDLRGLPPGPHGFHVHEYGNCAAGSTNGQPVAAASAGGHFDPAHSGHHEGPTGHGHLGDLPLLVVAADGNAKATLTAPMIKSLDALRGHALMIHAKGDNYSDQPEPLGGGGPRIACGVIQ